MRDSCELRNNREVRNRSELELRPENFVWWGKVKKHGNHLGAKAENIEVTLNCKITTESTLILQTLSLHTLTSQGQFKSDLKKKKSKVKENSENLINKDKNKSIIEF